MLLSQCRGDGKLLQVGWVDQGESQGMECVCVCGGGIVWYRGVGGWSRRVSKTGGCDASEIRSQSSQTTLLFHLLFLLLLLLSPFLRSVFWGELQGAHFRGGYGQEERELEGEVYVLLEGGGGSLENKQ